MELTTSDDNEIKRFVKTFSHTNNDEITLGISLSTMVGRIKYELVKQIQEDYIHWCLSNSNDKKYKGRTPFYDWKLQAEIKDMQHYD